MNQILLATADGICKRKLPLSTRGNRRICIDYSFFRSVGSSANAAAQYGFQLTNGDGDVIADFSSTKLSIGGSSNATTNVANEIEASVIAAISAGIVANFGNDSSFDDNEFEVTYSGDTLTIRNKEGRSLAIEKRK